ncbi:MAG: glycosyltransferase family 2 protein [Syntrophaceae bacterium]
MDTTYPKISVMIPTYNRAHYLIDAIESALTQDYTNFEVIVSDNASTDQTAEVVKKYFSDNRFRYYRNDKNIGAGPNWERLLYEYAQGEYGKFLPDDDCIVDKNHLSKAATIIQKYNVKIIFSAPVSQYEDEKKGLNISLELDEIVPRQWWIENMSKTKYGVTYFPSCCSGTIFELDHARKTGSFKGEIFADYAYAVKQILYEEKTGYIKVPSYLERRHPGQDGRSSFQNSLNGIYIFDHIYEYGIKLNTIDRELLAALRFRGLIFFTKAFLLPNWIPENGCNFPSLLRFMKELKKLDRRLPLVALTDLNIMTQFFLYDTVLYRILRKAYRNVRSSNALRYLRHKWMGSHKL